MQKYYKFIISKSDYHSFLLSSYFSVFAFPSLTSRLLFSIIIIMGSRFIIIRSCCIPIWRLDQRDRFTERTIPILKFATLRINNFFCRFFSRTYKFYGNVFIDSLLLRFYAKIWQKFGPFWAHEEFWNNTTYFLVCKFQYFGRSNNANPRLWAFPNRLSTTPEKGLTTLRDWEREEEEEQFSQLGRGM